MARAGLGLSPQDLADRAGVHYITLRRLEAGEGVSEDTRGKIEKALADAGATFSKRGGRIGATVPE
ncbi:helix-turn-helix domain-containing protein [Aurantiacibacter zhengii]|nr:helix-turn-helix transcriptional regulator [Aurantiacibacter zhengii]